MGDVVPLPCLKHSERSVGSLPWRSRWWLLFLCWPKGFRQSRSVVDLEKLSQQQAKSIKALQSLVEAQQARLRTWMPDSRLRSRPGLIRTRF